MTSSSRVKSQKRRKPGARAGLSQSVNDGLDRRQSGASPDRRAMASSSHPAVETASISSAVISVAAPPKPSGRLFEQVHAASTSTWSSADRYTDRKSVVEGKSVAVRVDIGGRRIIKKKKQPHHTI